MFSNRVIRRIINVTRLEKESLIIVHMWFTLQNWCNRICYRSTLAYVSATHCCFFYIEKQFSSPIFHWICFRYIDKFYGCVKLLNYPLHVKLLECMLTTYPFDSSERRVRYNSMTKCTLQSCYAARKCELSKCLSVDDGKKSRRKLRTVLIQWTVIGRMAIFRKLKWFNQQNAMAFDDDIRQINVKMEHAPH